MNVIVSSWENKSVSRPREFIIVFTFMINWLRYHHRSKHRDLFQLSASNCFKSQQWKKMEKRALGKVYDHEKWWYNVGDSNSSSSSKQKAGREY